MSSSFLPCSVLVEVLGKLLLEGDSFFSFFKDRKDPPNKLKTVFRLHYPVSLYFELKMCGLAYKFISFPFKEGGRKMGPENS